MRNVLQLVRDHPAAATCSYAVSAFLMLGIALQVAAIARPSLPTGSGSIASIRANASQATAPGKLDAAVIVAAHLFGAANDEQAISGRTDLPLTLVGTMASSDPARGMALLKLDPAGPSRLFVVGVQLPGSGALLREVHNGSIVLDRAGQLETLAFLRPAKPLDLGGATTMQLASGSGGFMPASDAPTTVVVRAASASYTAVPGEPIDTSVPGAPLLEIPNSSP